MSTHTENTDEKNQEIVVTHKFVEVENTDPVPLGCTYMVKKHKLVKISEN